MEGGSAEGGKGQISFPLPHSAFRLISELRFPWGSSLHFAEHAMIPLIPDELLAATVQWVCYCCTAIGVALTIFLAPRA